MKNFCIKKSLIVLVGVCHALGHAQPNTATSQAGSTDYSVPQATSPLSVAEIEFQILEKLSSGVSKDSDELKALEAARARQSEIEKSDFFKKLQINVLMQEKNKSCGAAALANLLTYFYGTPLTEKQLLASISADGDTALTMQDISVMASKNGFKMAGYQMDLATLSQLKQAVIVRLEGDMRDDTRKINHFDILKKSGLSSQVDSDEELEKILAMRKEMQLNADSENQENDLEAELSVNKNLSSAAKEEGHFVVLEKIVNGVAYIKDPQVGNKKIGIKKFLEAWKNKPDERGFVLGVIAKI
jgi:predicted double-glycine peptidase